jgi:hypothetical protein
MSSINNLSPERRKAVVVASCCACMASGPVLLRGHHVLLGFWLAFEILLIITAIALLAKATKKEKEAQQ